MKASKSKLKIDALVSMKRSPARRPHAAFSSRSPISRIMSMLQTAEASAPANATLARHSKALPAYVSSTEFQGRSQVSAAKMRRSVDTVSSPIAPLRHAYTRRPQTTGARTSMRKPCQKRMNQSARGLAGG
jgi:hypothetical protein